MKSIPIYKYDKDVIDYVNKNNVINYLEINNDIKNIYGRSISRSCVYKILKRNNITRKRIQTKKHNYKLQNDYNNRLVYLRKAIKKRKKRIISIDETSIDFIIPLNYGWSKSGIRCIRHISNKRYRVSLLIAISMNRIVNYHIKEGSFNKDSFNDFMNETDENNKYYKYLMDNAKIHHNKTLNHTIKDKIIYNIPYCPEYNPIEYFFNKLKYEIKKNDINNMNELKLFIDGSISRLRFDNYFKKSYSNLKI